MTSHHVDWQIITEFLEETFFDVFREKKLFDRNDMRMGAMCSYKRLLTLYQPTLNNILEGMVFKIFEYTK